MKENHTIPEATVTMIAGTTTVLPLYGSPDESPITPGHDILSLRLTSLPDELVSVSVMIGGRDVYVFHREELGAENLLDCVRYGPGHHCMLPISESHFMKTDLKFT